MRTTSEGLSAIVDLKKIKQKPMIDLADHLISHVRMFTQKLKSKGEGYWTDLILKILTVYTEDLTYVDIAMDDIGDPDNNQAS